VINDNDNSSDSDDSTDNEANDDKDNNENPFNYDNLMENLNIPGFYNFVPILLISAIVLVFFKRKHI